MRMTFFFHSRTSFGKLFLGNKIACTLPATTFFKNAEVQKLVKIHFLKYSMFLFYLKILTLGLSSVIF